MSKHHHSQEDIYTSQVVQALEQKYCSSCSAAVVSSCLVSSQGLGARVVSRIYDGGRKAVYTAAVAAMMVQNLTPGAYAASSKVVSNGETSTGLVMPDGDITDLRISLGGTTISTVLESGGRELVSGKTSGTTINESAEQRVYKTGVASDTVINAGGSQLLGSGSTSGGTAIATVINGGVQSVTRNGIASNTQILEGGVQSVWNNGSASDTHISAGGTQQIASGGSATNTTVSSGGIQNVFHNGSSINVTQLSGGNINTRLSGGATTSVTGTNQNGETLSISNGVASNFIVNAGGYQYISAGGSAVNTLLNSGEMELEGGGVADTLTAQGGTISLGGGAGQFVGNTMLSGTVVDYTRYTSSRNTLSAENLSANGAVFNMSVDLENQEGDKLTVQSSYNGNAQISATNIGSSAQETTGDGIKLVEFSDPSVANGTFSLVGGTMVEGAYTYGLEQGTKAGEGKDYFLRSVDYAPIFKTMLNVPVMNVMVAQTGMNSLQRRLGDLQNMDNTGKKQGIWVRSYYRDVTVNDLAKTDMRLFGAEAGYDWLFRADEPTKLYAGVLVGYVNLNALETRKENGTYEKGDGETPSAGVYATLVNEEGWFVDIAARNFWTKLDLTSHNGSTPSPTYSPKRNVVAVSTEAGTNFIKSLSRNKFIRIEPKVEVAWMNAASGDTPVHNGVGDLHYEETNYLNGKAGVLISYNTKYGNDLLIEPLVELAYRYEFDGKGNVSYGGATEKSDLSGGSLEVNAGLNMQLTKDLYWYALGSYENGKKIEGWGVYAGVRYKFGGEDTTLPPGAVVQTQTAADKPATQKDQAALPKAGPEEVFHLLFKFGSDALEPAAVDAVRNFAKLYVSGKQTAPILLEGYTCDLGKPAYNKVLSRRRAEAVQKILMQQGISKDKITVKAYGDTQFVKKGFGGRKDYRRVVVSVNDK